MALVNRKPEPLYSAPTRAVCPVCGKTSYSAAGVHPQCAMAASDKEQVERLKAHPPVPEESAAPKPQRHEKRCPRCQTFVHVRKLECDCGHRFGPAVKPQGNQLR